MTLFEGLSAFPITPTDPQGRVDTKALCRLLARLKKADVNSVGLLGSTGGYVYLSRSERQRAVAATVDFFGDFLGGFQGGKVPVIVGIGALRTDEAQHLARDARDAGADGVLLAPVSYAPLTEEEVYRHFVAVAGATDLPLCIYNNPGTTHFTFSRALLGRLSHVENIAAVKMPLPQGEAIDTDLADLRKNTREGFAIGYSGDWGCAAGLLAGADTWYSVVGGLFPVPAMKLTKAAQRGDVEEVQRLERYFQPLWTLFKEFGGLRVIYAAVNILSLSDASPHLPIQPLNPADQKRVAAAIEVLDALE